ncbi:hypothetical protein [Phytoactinopolyspora halotolerans]|uniref:hypothetical protein n=1 Tax=Phytoactinopolyspora halotolerans TaxID=1981512 RepID=UPI001C20B8DB|nr:hypothetical protein [Phytoactinopolyspora halotolerans]
MFSRRKVSAVAVAAVGITTVGSFLIAAQASPSGSVGRDVPVQDVVAQRVAAQDVADAEVPEYVSDVVRTYDAFDANQGVAVDRRYFYAVNNRTITKHARDTGEPLLQFAGAEGGPIEHLDSGAVVNGKLYAAHSNYSEWPMESSIEVFDTRTMEHIDTHSFGIYRGSLTWLDRHDGAWWATFANYNREKPGPGGEPAPYGYTYNTQVVKMDDDFQVVESWTIPKEILDRFELMSNSGGSWGPDGRLYLTGHDLPEAYVMKLPAAGGELEWVGTVALPQIEGQGIAWDHARGREATLWGISRDTRQVTSFSVPVHDIEEPERDYWDVLGPGEFQQ